jgi:hypothetical protein
MSGVFLYGLITIAWLQTAAAVFSTFSKTMIRLRFASVLADICGLAVSAASANPAAIFRYLITLPTGRCRGPRLDAEEWRDIENAYLGSASKAVTDFGGCVGDELAKNVSRSRQRPVSARHLSTILQLFHGAVQ